MSSFSLIQKLAAHSSRQTADFAHDRCLRKRLNRCACANCRDACSAGAISLKDRRISFDALACTGCMRCTTACPNDAFTFSGFEVDSLCFSEDKAELVVLSCTRQSQIYPEERLLPCLGGITNEHLLALDMSGESALAFNISSCAGCENYHGVEDFLHRLAWLKQEAGPLFRRKQILISDQQEAAAFDQSARRSYLSSLKESLYETIGAQFSFHTGSSRPAVRTSRRIPVRVQIKAHLMEKAASTDRQALSRLINHRLIINQDCNLCPLCKGICPTGALKIEQTEGKKELVFAGTLCSGCGLCVSFCKQEALSLQKPDSWIAAAGPRCHPPSPVALLPQVEQPGEQCERERA
jgi:ferredoxin